MIAPSGFKASARLERYGFGDDAVPRKRIAPRMLHPAIPGWFPTPKSKNGRVRTSSPLMMDALLHADCNPLAVRISGFPIEIHWWARDLHGDHYKRSDIPDFGIAWRDGQLSFHHATPYRIQCGNPSFDENTAQLRRVFEEEHGAVYSVLDERDLNIRPRAQNTRTMWKHDLGDLDPAALDAVRVALERCRRAGEAATIGSLRDACPMKPFWAVFDGGAPPRRLDEVDRVFSAIMTLAIAGEVSLDLGRPFSDTTAVGPGVLQNVGRQK